MSEILSAAIVALPVSIGIGILRYRLYDIDRIISRTLAHAIVTGLLVGVYAAVVLLTTRILAFHAPVAVAASTLAAAALFNPLRRRVQRAVDRRFNRARYDADQTVAAFAARLKTRSTWARSATTWPRWYPRSGTRAPVSVDQPPRLRLAPACSPPSGQAS